MSEINDKIPLERFIVTEERGKSNTHRINELSEQLDDMASHQTILNKHTEDIKMLKDQTSTIHRLAITQEHMATSLNSMAEDNREQMGKVTETLSRMNESLIGMNHSQQEMSNKIEGMQEDLSSTKRHVKEVEKIAEKGVNKGKFDFLEFFTGDMIKSITLTFVAAIIGVLLTYIGLK